MHPECPNCKQDFQIEPGFYFGAAAISWALQVLLGVALGLVIMMMGKTEPMDFIIPIIIAFIITTPYIAALSRSIWLSFFVKKD